MSNCVSVVVGDVIRLEIYELLGGVSGYYLLFQFVVLRAEVDLFIRARQDSILSKRRPTDVSARIFEKMAFRHAPLDIDVPPALVLSCQQPLHLL